MDREAEQKARAAASAMIGGTASVIAGGKFANGALSGAFGYLYNQQGRSARAAKLREARLANEDPYAVGIKDFGELFIRHAKDKVMFGSSVEVAYGAGVNVTSVGNLEGDTSISAMYSQGVMFKPSFSIGADVYSSGEINGFYQSVEFCAIGCVNIDWNYVDFRIGTSITPGAGFSYKIGIIGSGRDVLELIK